MKEPYATHVEVSSMLMLQNVMILTGSTELNGQDVDLVKDASCILGKKLQTKKVRTKLQQYCKKFMIVHQNIDILFNIIYHHFTLTFDNMIIILNSNLF